MEEEGKLKDEEREAGSDVLVLVDGAEEVKALERRRNTPLLKEEERDVSTPGESGVESVGVMRLNTPFKAEILWPVDALTLFQLSSRRMKSCMFDSM